MLIQVFGIWLMASNIALLEPKGSQRQNCNVYMVSGGGYAVTHIYGKIENHTCPEVAAEINKQIKEAK